MLVKMNAFISITGKCNLACEYCFYNTGTARKIDKSINLSDFLKICCWLTRMGYDSITITGGEPLLHDNLIDFVKICKNLGLNSFLITNGIMLNYTISKKLFGAGLKGISISLDSFNKNIHNRTRGSFDKIISGINILKKIGRY